MRPATTRIILLLLVLLCSKAPALGQPDEHSGAAIDWWDHSSLAPHVDTFAGEITLRIGASGRVVVAIDEHDRAGEEVARVSRLFVFDGENASLNQREVYGPGVVRYWHQGMRVSLPTLGESFELRLSDTALPRGSKAWGEPTAAATGFGLVASSGEAIETMSLAEALGFGDNGSRDAVTALAPDIENPDPGGGGEGTCASSCSIGCDHGQCQVSCTGPYCAKCRCSDGRSWCSCVRKN